MGSERRGLGCIGFFGPWGSIVGNLVEGLGCLLGVSVVGWTMDFPQRTDASREKEERKDTYTVDSKGCKEQPGNNPYSPFDYNNLPGALEIDQEPRSEQEQELQSLRPPLVEGIHSQRKSHKQTFEHRHKCQKRIVERVEAVAVVGAVVGIARVGCKSEIGLGRRMVESRMMRSVGLVGGWVELIQLVEIGRGSCSTPISR